MDRMNEANPYHILLGVTVGAGTALVCVKTWQLLSEGRDSEELTSQRDLRFERQALYRSPGPLYSTTSEPRNNRWRTDDASTPNGDHATSNGNHATPNGNHTTLNGSYNESSSLQSRPLPNLTPINESIEEPDFDVPSPQLRGRNGHRHGDRTTSFYDNAPSPGAPSEEAVVSSRDSEALLNLLYRVGESQARTDSVVHRGISCNICEANPLTGVRFKCVNCIDYDVCERCEPKCGHDFTHVLAKISIPIPPLCNPRKTLLPLFYPGKKVKRELPWTEVVSLSSSSHFESFEIESLFEQYRSLSSQEGITKETFHGCLGPLKKNLIVEQLFKFYDADCDGFIGFADFIHGMSVLSKGTQKEKMTFSFRGYDLDGDRFVTSSDLLDMLRAYHVLSMELVRDVIKSCEEEMMAAFQDDTNQPISTVFNAPIPESNGNVPTMSLSEMKKTSKASFSEDATFDSYLYAQSRPKYTQRDKSATTAATPGGSRKPLRSRLLSSASANRWPAVEEMTADAINELVETIMSEADTDGDGRLSESEFREYAIVDTNLMAWFDAVGTVF